MFTAAKHGMCPLFKTKLLNGFVWNEKKFIGAGNDPHIDKSHVGESLNIVTLSKFGD